MRKLNTADLFTAARAVKASGLRADLQKMILHLSRTDDIQQVGVDTILTVIEAFAEKKAEAAIYEVLAGPFEMAAEDVAVLDLEQLMDKLELLSEDGGLQIFFKRLSGILLKN